MATTTRSKRQVRFDARSALYAYVGAGQVLIDGVRNLPGRADPASWRRNIRKTYQDLAERGEKLVGSIRLSRYTQRALEQSKVARSQVKAASTSARKAAGTTAQAARAAAKKAG